MSATHKGKGPAPVNEYDAKEKKSSAAKPPKPAEKIAAPMDAPAKNPRNTVAAAKVPAKIDEAAPISKHMNDIVKPNKASRILRVNKHIKQETRTCITTLRRLVTLRDLLTPNYVVDLKLTKEDAALFPKRVGDSDNCQVVEVRMLAKNSNLPVDVVPEVPDLKNNTVAKEGVAGREIAINSIVQAEESLDFTMLVNHKLKDGVVLFQTNDRVDPALFKLWNNVTADMLRQGIEPDPHNPENVMVNLLQNERLAILLMDNAKKLEVLFGDTFSYADLLRQQKRHKNSIRMPKAVVAALVEAGIERGINYVQSNTRPLTGFTIRLSNPHTMSGDFSSEAIVLRSKLASIEDNLDLVYPISLKLAITVILADASTPENESREVQSGSDAEEDSASSAASSGSDSGTD